MSSDRDRAPDSLLAPGDRLADGKYAIVDIVGAGGMGQVFRARHTLLERQVAIKVLHPGMTADPKVEARFLREARATSRLDHRNSMQVLDFGTEHRADGAKLLYIVMEYLDGRELSEIVRSAGPLPTARIVRIAAQVCAALFQAHENGVIHRDLKPENIMILPHVDDDGRATEQVKVCDFGIAKIQSSEEYQTGDGSKLTAAGEIFGTPYYMSPEQARGKKLDPRSDIYSLGVVLFELATARLPFTGENLMGILAQQISDPPPRPSALNPEIDPELERTILACLEKDPDRRFQTVRELRMALLAIVDDAPAPRGSLSGPISASAVTLRASDPATPTPSAFEAAKTTPLELTGAPTPAGLPAPARRSPLRLVIAALLVAAAGAAGAYLLLSATADPPAGAPVPRPAVASGARGAVPGTPAPDFVSAAPAPAREPAAPAATDAAPADEPVAEDDEPSGSHRRKRRDRSAAAADAPPSEATAPEPEMSPAPEPPEPPEPAPAPAAAAPPPTPPAAPPAKPAALDARVGTALTSVQGSLPQGPIRQGVKRVVDDYRVCYRQAAKRAGRDWSGQVIVRFVINVDGRARDASASGGGLPGLAACVASASAKIRSATRPDTGTVKVELGVRFTPLD